MTGNTAAHCQHDAAFFANPDYQTIIYGQAWEIEQERIANGYYDNPENNGEGE